MTSKADELLMKLVETRAADEKVEEPTEESEKLYRMISKLHMVRRNLQRLYTEGPFDDEEAKQIQKMFAASSELDSKWRQQHAKALGRDESGVGRDRPCGVCQKRDRCIASPYFDRRNKMDPGVLAPGLDDSGECLSSRIDVPCRWCGSVKWLRPTRDGKSTICRSCGKDPQIA